MATPFDKCKYMGMPVTFSAVAPTNPVIGSLMFDDNTCMFQVFNGSKWTQVSPEAMADVDYRSMTEDERLCAANPGLAELKNQLDEAKEKYEAFKALVKE